MMNTLVHLAIADMITLKAAGSIGDDERRDRKNSAGGREKKKRGKERKREAKSSERGRNGEGEREREKDGDEGR